MGHDVFISYSKADKVAADAACAILEQEGVRCWIAPRDIRPGVEWGEAIVDGIAGSSAFVVVFSADSNESPQVRREVERAVSRGLSILPVRVEDVQPTGSMEYFLSNSHWLDALTPPLDEHLHRLADSLKGLLDIETGDGAEEPAAPPEPAEWFYAVDGSPIGPMTRSDLEGKIKGGEIGADVRVLKTGEDTWTRVRKYPGLNTLLPVDAAMSSEPPQIPSQMVEDIRSVVEGSSYLERTYAAIEPKLPPFALRIARALQSVAQSRAELLPKLSHPAKRLIAAGVDFFVIVVMELLFAVPIVGVVFSGPGGLLYGTGLLVQTLGTLLYIAFIILLFCSYFVMFEYSGLRATPGKLLVGLKVQASDGTSSGFWRTFWRALTKLVTIVPLGAGLLGASRANGYRTAHDKFGRTVVVEIPPRS